MHVGLAALPTVVLEAFFRLKYVAANRAAASTPRVPRNEILKGKFLPQRLVVTLVGLPRSAGSEMVF
jgi:hypothetical protein